MTQIMRETSGMSVTFQACWITFSVHALVMMQGVKAGFFQAGKQAQNRPTVFRMPVDERHALPR